MAQAAGIVITPIDVGDAGFHQLMHRAATSAQWHGTGLTDEQLGPLMQMQSDAQVRQYSDQYPHAQWSKIEFDGEVAGRVIVDRTATELRVVDMVVLDSAQGNGIGSRVLTSLHDEAQANAVPLVASVLASNEAARSLYARLGFDELDISDDGLRIALIWPPDS